MVGSYVEARIEGKSIENVVRLERQYLRQNDTVWLNRDGVLEIRNLDVDFRDDDFAFVSKGLEAGDLVVTTNLATVVDGASLRLHGEPE
jgi:multidrug efflux pump subunit AcrA (membrane-fusion protein)